MYHAYKCILGDFNFRIDLPNKEVRELIQKRNWGRLLDHDDLTKEKRKGDNPILNNFHE